MGAKHGFTKVKKLAQSKSDASGWNQHVNKYQKRIANKVVRRILKVQDGGKVRSWVRFGSALSSRRP